MTSKAGLRSGRHPVPVAAILRPVIHGRPRKVLVTQPTVEGAEPSGRTQYCDSSVGRAPERGPGEALARLARRAGFSQSDARRNSASQG